MDNAHGLKFLQGFGDLSTAALQVIFFLGNIPCGELNRQTAGKGDPVRISSYLAGRAPHVFETLGQFRGSDANKVRKPRVSIPAGSLLRQFPFASNPDWNSRFLKRFWAESDVIDIVVPAVKAYMLVLPNLIQELEMFICIQPTPTPIISLPVDN